jgi:hypothetical protein
MKRSKPQHLAEIGVKVKCTRPDGSCDHIWSTRTLLKSITCPSCRYTNNREKAIEKYSEYQKIQTDEVEAHDN